CSAFIFEQLPPRHMRLGATPPIAASVVDRILKMEDCISVIGARQTPKPRAPALQCGRRGRHFERLRVNSTQRLRASAAQQKRCAAKEIKCSISSYLSLWPSARA